MMLKICSIIEICTVYRIKVQKYHGARWYYKLRVSAKFAKNCHIKTQQLKEGRWRYKLTVSWKVAKSKPYKDITTSGWTLVLQQKYVSEIDKAYHTRNKDSRVDVGIINLQFS